MTYSPQKTHVMAARGLAHALGLKGWFEFHCGEYCVYSDQCVDPGCGVCDLLNGVGGGFFGTCIDPNNRFPEIKN